MSKFEVGDWVCPVYGKPIVGRVTCLPDDRTIQVDRDPNDGLGWIADQFWAATQEEIDAVPFREGDLATYPPNPECGMIVLVAPTYSDLIGHSPTDRDDDWRHATPEEYREHHKEEEPTVPYYEYTDQGVFGNSGDQITLTAHGTQVVSLAYSEEREQFWKDKTKQFEEEIARIQEAFVGVSDRSTKLHSLNAGLEEDVESLTEEIAALQAPKKPQTWPCNPGQIMQDVVTKAGPFVILDQPKTSGGYVKVYRGKEGGPGDSMGHTHVFVEALEPYVPKPSLPKRAAPYLVGTATAVLTAAAGHWLILSLHALYTQAGF